VRISYEKNIIHDFTYQLFVRAAIDSLVRDSKSDTEKNTNYEADAGEYETGDTKIRQTPATTYTQKIHT